MPKKLTEILAQANTQAFCDLGIALLIRSERDGYASLAEPECRFYAVYRLDMDVNNGGFFGYFTNTAGNLAADALIGLEQMGACHIHSLLQRAASVFPGGVVPKSQGEREVFLDDSTPGDKWADLDKPNRFKAVFEPLDKEYYHSDDRVIALALTFARAHVGEFRVD